MSRASEHDAREILVRKAARALGNNGLVNAYGHCSARIDATSFLVCAAKPMGMIGAGESGTVVPIEGPLPDGVLGEVRTHQQIYKRRPDVHGIARTFGPNVLALSALGATPKSRHGFGAYFAPEPPLWNDPQLLRNDEQASKLADQLGNAKAIVMRGNGAITVAESLEAAVVLAWYLDDAARVELAVRAAGGGETAPVMSLEESERRAVTAGGIYERMWAFMTYRDPE
jgi:HCOMODA/2-hydroxy-3-carboxy-muconic semialdehyde decarboxylase